MTPPLNAPIWEVWVRPVLTFIRHAARTWEALRRFAREQGFGLTRVQHCLAWAESHGFAMTIGRGKQLVWVGL